jgi:hypothetical protein
MRIAAFIGVPEIALPFATPHGRLHSIPGVVDARKHWGARTNLQRYRNSRVHLRGTDDQRNQQAEMLRREGEA